MSKHPVICIVAGHSGGHITPGLTYAKELRTLAPHTRVVLFTTSTQLDAKIARADASADQIIQLAITAAPQKKIVSLLRCASQTATSFVQSVWHLARIKPTKVIAMGGYISVPVCLAARLLRIPVELFELNVTPGKAVNFLAPCASSIHTCFEETKNYFTGSNCVLTPYPVRFNVTEKNNTPEHARTILGLDPHKKTIFIQGGSQGSVVINSLIKQLIKHHPEVLFQLQFIHQTGSFDTTDWHAFYQQHQIAAIVFDYCHDVANYYCAADVIVCRSGAGTLFEVLFFNKQCITIPLETPATDHQIHNAKTMAKLFPTLFCVLQQEDTTHNPELFFTHLTQRIDLHPWTTLTHQEVDPKYT